MFQKSTPELSSPIRESDTKHVQDDVETVVGPSVKVEGDFASEGNIVVKGIVSGSVKTSKTLTVEDGAKIFANVSAGDAVVSGGIRGNVKIGGRLELTETAQIQGDVNCGILSVAPGALMQGKITMKGVNLKDEASEKQDKKRISLGRTLSKAEEEENTAE